MNVDLSGKVAMVTGAGRGIGKAIADALGRNGASVVYTDLDSPDLTASAAAAKGKALVMNVTDEAQVNAVVQQIKRDYGRLDILVNNAGVNTSDRVSIEQFPRREWDRLIDVDLTGLFLVTKAVTPIMIEQGGGRIINIASVVGVVPLRLQCAFAAAKAGVVNLSRAMAIELGGRGVLTNCICPGSVVTEEGRKSYYSDNGPFKGRVQELINHIPVGRPGTPDEIAHAALFLAAPESTYVNGAVLCVDGGWTAGYMREF
jgi:NAD(P)-dependent dehydrogenase (short-subunit alcohol dehydrogenase family)